MSAIFNKDKWKDFIRNTKKIVSVARKPTGKEVEIIARVSGLGILLVGGIAFLIHILGNLVSEFFLPPEEEESTGSTSVLLLNLLMNSQVVVKFLISSNPLLIVNLNSTLAVISVVV
ncbi:MAG: protein translocase SEC61 complex subunit gamma [Promethearchaeota archaeon]